VLKKIDLYIFRNIVFSFLVSFIILSAVMIIGDVIKIYSVLFEGTSLELVLKILLHISLFLSIFTVPMALTISINYVYSDMSYNSEITALRSAGISPLRIYFPALIFTVLVLAFLFYDHFYLAYKSKMSYWRELKESIGNKLYIALKPNEFYEVNGKVLWVNSLSPDHKKLNGVFFSSGNKVFVSKKAYLEDTPKGILIRFFDVKMLAKGTSFTELGSFSEYDMIFSNRKFNLNKSDVGYWTLDKILKDYRKTHSIADLFEINKRISLVLSAFVLSFIGFSLGLISARAGKSAGVVLNIFIFFLFYILLMFSQSIFKSNHIIWPVYMPNLIIGLIGLYTFYSKVKA